MRFVVDFLPLLSVEEALILLFFVWFVTLDCDYQDERKEKNERTTF